MLQSFYKPLATNCPGKRFHDDAFVCRRCESREEDDKAHLLFGCVAFCSIQREFIHIYEQKGTVREVMAYEDHRSLAKMCRKAAQLVQTFLPNNVEKDVDGPG